MQSKFFDNRNDHMRTHKHISQNLFVTRKDHQLFPFWGDKAGFMHRLPYMLEQIHSENPDTVALQEVLNDEEALDYISSWADEHGYIFKSVPYFSRKELCRLGFLIKKTTGIRMVECNYTGNKTIDTIQGILVYSAETEVQLFVNIHVGTKTELRRDLATYGVKAAISNMLLCLEQQPAALMNVVVSGDMNAFATTEELPRADYIEKLRQSIKEAVNEHLGSDKFDAVEVFEQAVSNGKSISTHSFFPAPTDFLVTDVESSARAIQSDRSFALD